MFLGKASAEVFQLYELFLAVSQITSRELAKYFINTSGNISVAILFGLISILIKSLAALYLRPVRLINDTLPSNVRCFILLLYDCLLFHQILHTR